ncbi:hypothetical protein Scep_019747 [Stephania cephalantha]|uniref:Uncharacterized protein n=1 Tax=Stephania cephalantha TaxID=152367 RepID=A0AAP0IBG7_9MAGN
MNEMVGPIPALSDLEPSLLAELEAAAQAYDRRPGSQGPRGAEVKSSTFSHLYFLAEMKEVAQQFDVTQVPNVANKQIV